MWWTLTNLQRQILHGTAYVGQRKVRSAADRLDDLNPHVRVVPLDVRLSSANARQIIRDYDLVVDGSDNFPTRYLVNDACVLEGRPLVYGSIFRFDGQVSLFHPPAGPCYRCLFAEPPAPDAVPSCAEGGVLGVLPGIIGSLQALEAIKWIVGAGQSLLGRLLLFDALKVRFREIALRRDSACPVCGDSPTITELIDYEAFCGLAPVEGPIELETSVDRPGPPSRRRRGPLLLDVREPWEHGIARLEGSVLIPLVALPARSASCRRAPRSSPTATTAIGACRGEVPARRRVRDGHEPRGWHRCLGRAGGAGDASILRAGWGREPPQRSCGECRRGDSNPHGLSPTAP